MKNNNTYRENLKTALDNYLEWVWNEQDTEMKERIFAMVLSSIAIEVWKDPFYVDRVCVEDKKWWQFWK